MDAAHKSATSVAQQLLRLLMLQSSAPEMMAPAQIEAADRVIEQLGGEFTLRPRGFADNPFCFDPTSEGRPRRAEARPAAANAELRYFGAGTGYIALERLYRELTSARTADLKAFGKDLPLHAQVSAIAHLLAFWGEAPLFSPVDRSPANGTFRMAHGYAQAWQQLSSARSGMSELTLAEDGDIAAQAPETWTLRDAGGDELGAEIAQPSSAWPRCGDLVGASTQREAGCWVGVIRSLHAEPGRPLQADFLVLSRDPRALQLRAVIGKGEETIFSEESARQFDFNRVRAIILADGSAGNPTLLLPPESWAKDRVFEAPAPEGSRFLRAGQLLRRGDDYVQAAFEWAEKPD